MSDIRGPPKDHHQHGENQMWEPPPTSDCSPRDVISHGWEGNTSTRPSFQHRSATAQSMHCRPLVRMMHASATPDWIGASGEGQVRLGKPKAKVMNMARGGVACVCWHMIMSSSPESWARWRIHCYKEKKPTRHSGFSRVHGNVSCPQTWW